MPKKDGTRPPLDYTNAAGRLYRILSELRAHKGNRDINQVAYVFGLDEGAGARDMLTAVQAVWADFDDLLDAIEALHDNKTLYSLYKQDVTPIQSALLTLVVNPPGHFASSIDEAPVTALRYIAASLPQEEAPSQSEIDELRAAIDQLRVEIEGCSDVNSRLRRFLLDLVNAMRNGLEKFNVRGGKGLREELSRIIGELYLHKDYASQVKKHVGLWNRLTSVLDVMTRVVTVYDKSRPAIDSMVRLLGFSDSDSAPQNRASAGS